MVTPYFRSRHTSPAASADTFTFSRERHVEVDGTRSIEPALALAAETSKLDRTLSALVNQAYGLTPAEIDLMWKTVKGGGQLGTALVLRTGCIVVMPNTVATVSALGKRLE